LTTEKNPLFFRVFIIFAVYLFVFGGCSMPDKQANNDKDLTIQAIAYNVRNNAQYTIYLEENGEYVPYLVLTDDYNGNCLLLRKYLLDELMRFNPNGLYSAYYENCEIDEYLNNEFFDRLPSKIKSEIIKSEIVITAKESLGVCGTDTIVIERNVFLLSYAELGGSKSSTNIAEGNQLSFFKDNESRIAKHQSNKIGSWWLRTPNTWYDNVACGVSEDGVVGIGGIGGVGEDYINGIRPAFCLPQTTPVYEDELNGEKAYIIANK